MDLLVEDGSIEPMEVSLDEDYHDTYQKEKGVQSDNMPVFVRMRPLLPQEKLSGYESCLKILEDNTVRAAAPLDSTKTNHEIPKKYQDFTFSHVFGPDVSQLSFFKETMNTTVKSFIEGQNALVFTYGSSGSGKTFSMQGKKTEPGIIPLTIQLLFQCIQEKQLQNVPFKPLMASKIINLDETVGAKELLEQNTEKEKVLQPFQNEDCDSTVSSNISGYDCDNSIMKDISLCPSFVALEHSCRSLLEIQGNYYYSVWVSFIEIYNEQVFDLLQPFTRNKRQNLSLGEDNNRSIYIKGLKEVNVSNSEEVMNLLRLGKRNLKIASTKLNYQSSRSHCIFNVKFIRMIDTKNPSKVYVNTLSFCDLAGSERCEKTKNTGIRLKESSSINTSLMVLGRCIKVLRQNQTLKEKKLIPFRDSKLTRLFSNFFTGKGKATMIVNISPSSHTFDETLNVLKFSALAQQVITKDCSLSNESLEFIELDAVSNAVWDAVSNCGGIVSSSNSCSSSLVSLDSGFSSLTSLVEQSPSGQPKRKEELIKWRDSIILKAKQFCETREKAAELRDSISSKENESKEASRLFEEKGTNISFTTEDLLAKEEIISELNNIVFLKDNELFTQQEVILKSSNILLQKEIEIYDLKEKICILEAIQINDGVQNNDKNSSENDHLISAILELLSLLQRIENVATRNCTDLLDINKEKSEQITSINKKFDVLNKNCGKIKKMESEKKIMTRLLLDKELKITDLKQTMIEQKNLDEADKNALKQQHESELREVLKLQKLLKKENERLMSEKENKAQKPKKSNTSMKTKSHQLQKKLSVATDHLSALCELNANASKATRRRKKARHVSFHLNPKVMLIDINKPVIGLAERKRRLFALEEQPPLTKMPCEDHLPASEPPQPKRSRRNRKPCCAENCV